MPIKRIVAEGFLNDWWLPAFNKAVDAHSTAIEQALSDSLFEFLSCISEDSEGGTWVYNDENDDEIILEWTIDDDSKGALISFGRTPLVEALNVIRHLYHEENGKITDARGRAVIGKVRAILAREIELIDEALA